MPKMLAVQRLRNPESDKIPAYVELAIIHLILMLPLLDRYYYYYYPHFTDAETEQ